jgi:hypothetical protein
VKVSGRKVRVDEKGKERHEINTEKHLTPAQIVLVAIYFVFSRPYTSRTIELNPFHHPLRSLQEEEPRLGGGRGGQGKEKRRKIEA